MESAPPGGEVATAAPHAHAHAHGGVPCNHAHGHGHGLGLGLGGGDGGDGGGDAAASEAPIIDDLTDGEEGWKNPLGSGSLITKTMISPTGKFKPEIKQQVILEVKGWVKATKKVFEDTKIDCYLGDESLVPGLELAVRMMREGEVALVRMAARFAYGDRGLDAAQNSFGTSVPPGAAVEYKVKVCSVGKMLPDEGKMTPNERIRFSTQRKKIGNKKYKFKEYPVAVKIYEEALNYIGTSSKWKSVDEDRTDDLKQLKIDCENNLCAALIGMKNFEKASRAASRVLKLDSRNVKAIERSIRSYLATNNLKMAKKMLGKAKEYHPNNGRIKGFQQTLEEKEEKEKLRKDKFARTFQKKGLGYEVNSASADAKNSKRDKSIMEDMHSTGKENAEQQTKRQTYNIFHVTIGIALIGLVCGVWYKHHLDYS